MLTELSLIKKGTADSSRVLICNQFGQFWSGREWVSDESEGMLFLDNDKVAKVCQRIKREELIDKPSHVFMAPIIIEILSDEPISKKYVYDYVKNKCRIILEDPDIKDSVGFINIQLDRIEEKS